MRRNALTKGGFDRSSRPAARCAYLDSGASASVLDDGYSGSISPPAIEEFQLDQFVFGPSPPHGGWSS